MTRIFRILTRILAVLIAAVALGTVLVYYLLSQSIPDYNDRHTVAGISGRVEIVRDNHAVPHIFAERETDLFYGLGFAHAQDRLWQLLMLRRTAQGRLSDIFGRATLPVDQLMRTLDLNGVAEASLAFQGPEEMAVLNAYAAGINAQLAAIRDHGLGRGAPELFLFKPTISPWQPVDSLAILRLMALRMTDKAALEVLQARLALALDDERLADLFPAEQGAPVMALPDFAGQFDASPPGGAVDPFDHALLPLAEPGFAGASNAFAVGIERSATGGTLLATDPHLALSAPSIWMLARMEFPEGGVIGGSIPGLPAILLGRNSDFGWGFTVSYLDDQDVFIDKLNPDDPTSYLTPTGYETLEREDVIIELKDEPGETLAIQRTRHGPVLNPALWGISAILPPGHIASLAWTGLDPDDQTVRSMLNLMRARTVEDAQIAAADFGVPSLNIVMADTGSIAIQTAGRAPLRDPGHTSQGRIPAPGWLGQNGWKGYLPYEENPFIRDPESGVVVNTNNRLVDTEFPNHWSFDWGDDQRIQRAERMLNGREFHTLDSFIEIQTDIISPSARALVPLIARDLWYDGTPAPEGTAERRRQRAIDLLADWNGAMSEHNPEPLIYAAWVQALQRRLIADEVGTLANELSAPRALFIERVYRDIEGASIWCDVRQTSREETCVEIARDALDEALLTLSETYGDKLESWRWGDAHQAQHQHDVLGTIPFLDWFVNIRQETPGGDNTLMRAKTRARQPEPFLNVHAAGFRAIYDFADPEASVFVIATGQSGHFLSRHYDDLSQPWRRSEYIPMTLDPVLARGGSSGVTILEPQLREQ